MANIVGLADIQSALTTARVLIVEDDAMTGIYISRVLEEAGIEIAGVAATGGVALAIASKTPVSLALVDIKLLGPMGGIEVAVRLYDQYGIRTIFLTGNTEPETQRQAAAAYPLGFLIKPFLPSQLFNLLISLPPGALRQIDPNPTLQRKV